MEIMKVVGTLFGQNMNVPMLKISKTHLKLSQEGFSWFYSQVRSLDGPEKGIVGYLEKAHNVVEFVTIMIQSFEIQLIVISHGPGWFLVLLLFQLGTGAQIRLELKD